MKFEKAWDIPHSGSSLCWYVHAMPSPLTLAHYLRSTMRFWLRLNSSLAGCGRGFVTYGSNLSLSLSDHNTNINKTDLVLFTILIANSRMSWYFPGLEDNWHWGIERIQT